jgi:hypothetical protein
MKQDTEKNIAKETKKVLKIGEIFKGKGRNRKRKNGFKYLIGEFK